MGMKGECRPTIRNSFHSDWNLILTDSALITYYNYIVRSAIIDSNSKEK